MGRLARFPRSGPFATFEADLPPGTKDVIYVDVQNLARGCGPALAPGALVIDDLRIE